MEMHEQLIKEFQEFASNIDTKELTPYQFAYWLCNYSNYEVKESQQKK